jgi:hypothetical protein
MQNQVIYMPENLQTKNINDGLQQGMQSYIKSQNDQFQKKQLADVMTAVASAPDRATALSVAAASASKIRPDEMQLIMHAVDEAHPKDSTTLIEGTVYSKTTGAETPFYFHQKDAGKIGDPAFVAGITGLPAESFSLSKPPAVHEFVDGTGKSVGTFVSGMQPDGTMSSEDWTRKRQDAADNRASQHQTDQEKHQADTDTHMLNMEKVAQQNANTASRREQQSEKNANGDKESKRISTEQTRLQKYLVTQYGGKVLQDGSLDLSSLDEPKRKEFTEKFDQGSKLLEDGKVKTYGAAVRQLNSNSAKPAGKGAAVPDSGLPAGTKLGPVTSMTKDKKKVQEVLDSSGKRIGWQPI